MSMSSASAGSPHLIDRTWSASLPNEVVVHRGAGDDRVAAVQSWPAFQ
jgi:hypothetical protein